MDCNAMKYINTDQVYIYMQVHKYNLPFVFMLFISKYVFNINCAQTSYR